MLGLEYIRIVDIYLFIYLFLALFNVGQTIVTRLIKTNLTKTNTDTIDKNFKIFDINTRAVNLFYMIQFLFKLFNRNTFL